VAHEYLKVTEQEVKAFRSLCKSDATQVSAIAKQYRKSQISLGLCVISSQKVLALAGRIQFYHQSLIVLRASVQKHSRP
jgi:hypothetical protein